MTPHEKVEALYLEGKNELFITELTGFPKPYVSGVVFDLKCRNLAKEKPSGTASAENAHNPLRQKFEKQLTAWSNKHPGEEAELASLLAVWGTSQDEEKTLWMLIEMRLFHLAVEKTVAEAMRPQEITYQAGRRKTTHQPEEPERLTEEKVVDWLFQAPTADEWMLRFKSRQR